MLPAGRRPNVGNLGLEEVGVQMTKSGAIAVDDYSQTNVGGVLCCVFARVWWRSGGGCGAARGRGWAAQITPVAVCCVAHSLQVQSIWAIGDVTDRMALTPGMPALPAACGEAAALPTPPLSAPAIRLLAHTPLPLPCGPQLTPPSCGAVALMEAMALTRTMFGGEPTAPDHANIATAVFSHPQIGTVGMSEEQVGWGACRVCRVCAHACDGVGGNGGGVGTGAGVLSCWAGGCRVGRPRGLTLPPRCCTSRRAAAAGPPTPPCCCCRPAVSPHGLMWYNACVVLQALAAYGNIDVYTSSFRPMRNTIRWGGGLAWSVALHCADLDACSRAVRALIMAALACPALPRR